MGAALDVSFCEPQLCWDYPLQQRMAWPTKFLVKMYSLIW